MKRSALFLTALLFTAPAFSDVWPYYSDTGFPRGTVFAGPDAVSAPAYPAAYPVFNGDSTAVTPPEGYKSFQTTASNWWFWGNALPAPQNLSFFNNGELRFWVNSNRGDVVVEIKNSTGFVVSRTLTQLGWSTPGQWVQLGIPLLGVDLTAVTVPMAFSYGGSGQTQLYVDFVRYVNFTTAVSFSVLPKNSNNSIAQQLNWVIPSLPVTGGWVTSDQHLEMESDVNQFSWGVQIYTDNRAVDANPRYLGSAGTNPAGLIDGFEGKTALPLSWLVQGLPGSPVAGDPGQNFSWFYTKDIQTPNIPSQNTAAFVNGEPYVTVRNNKGIHFASGDTSFGPDSTLAFIYFQANFAQAVTPRTYKTNKLIVELFTL